MTVDDELDKISNREEWRGGKRVKPAKSRTARAADPPSEGDYGAKPPDPRDPAGAVTVHLSDFIAHLPPHTYIFRPTGEVWAGASINARIQPVTIGDKQISPTAWLDKNSAVQQMTWAPGEPELIRNRLIKDGGWFEWKDAAVLNTYRPPTIIHKRGDIAPWLEHLQAVFPDPEVAEHIRSCLAHRVQRPAEKLNHALVLCGEQGIGKDTILEPVKRAVGPWNFQEVSPRQILGRFNGYLKSVILRISEARDLGEGERFALYDHLKTIIAAPPDTLSIDEKNIREYVIPNVVAVILTTNYRIGGIYLPPDDRRHFVAYSNIKKGALPPEYFAKLYRWYEKDGGYEIVADHLNTLDISRFDPKAPPPQTEAFWQMMTSHRAPESAEIADRLEALRDPDAVTLDQLKTGAGEDLKAGLCDRKNSRAIPHRLADCGYEQFRNPDATSGLWQINGKRQAVYVKAALTPQEKLKSVRRLQ